MTEQPTAREICATLDAYCRPARCCTPSQPVIIRVRRPLTQRQADRIKAHARIYLRAGRLRRALHRARGITVEED